MKNIFGKHSGNIILIFVLAIAFFTRSNLFFQEGFISTDGARYALSGKSLVETGKFETYGEPELVFPPGYPIAIGIANYFFDNLLFSARFISFVFGLLLVFIFYLIGKKISGVKAGLIASFLVATTPMLVILSAESMSESLYMFFVSLSVLIYLSLSKKYGHRKAFLLGAVIGFAYLIRPEGVLLLVLVFSFLLQKKHFSDRKFYLLSVSIILISFTAVAASYVFFLYQNTGKLTLTAKSSWNVIPGIILNGKSIGETNEYESRLYEKTFSNYNALTNSIELPDKFENVGFYNFVFSDLNAFFERYKKGLKTETRIMFHAYELSLFLPFLFIFLISISEKKEDFKKYFVLFVIPLFLFFMFPVFHIEARYLVHVHIFVILLSSFGIAVVFDFLTSKIKKDKFANYFLIKILKNFTLLILIYAFIIASVYSSMTKAVYPREQKLAGEYLKKNTDHGNMIIMSRKPEIVFYAEGKSRIPVPYTTVENVLRFAKANKVNYIIIDERYLGIRENYKELVSLNEYSDEVVLFYENNDIKPIKIFEVLY